MAAALQKVQSGAPGDCTFRESWVDETLIRLQQGYAEVQEGQVRHRAEREWHQPEAKGFSLDGQPANEAGAAEGRLAASGHRLIGSDSGECKLMFAVSAAKTSQQRLRDR